MTINREKLENKNASPHHSPKKARHIAPQLRLIETITSPTNLIHLKVGKGVITFYPYLESVLKQKIVIRNHPSHLAARSPVLSISTTRKYSLQRFTVFR